MSGSQLRSFFGLRFAQTNNKARIA